MKYILAADDEPMNQMIIQEALNDKYEIICVNNGSECLESIEQRIPDLLLLDLSMPDVDGLEVCKTLRAKDNMKNLPIFVLSGFATKEHRELVLGAGANEFITKPFGIAELREAVSSVLDD